MIKKRTIFRKFTRNIENIKNYKRLVDSLSKILCKFIIPSVPDEIIEAVSINKHVRFDFKESE